jgi:toxin ParE1/3/4
LKVKFTPAARSQFLDALAYIHKENPSAAASLREKSHQALSRLTDFPESGRILPEFPDLPFREVVVAPYRFFYRIKKDTVWVVAVWHSAQLPATPGE